MGKRNRTNSARRKSFAVMLLVLMLPDEADASCSEEVCYDIEANYLTDYS